MRKRDSNVEFIGIGIFFFFTSLLVLWFVFKFWSFGFCVYRYGRICSGGSIRCYDVGVGVVLFFLGRMGGKGYSIFGRILIGGGKSE